MRSIYHLVLRSTWEKATGQSYVADSLVTEGFIHCSNAEQVATSANRFFAGLQDVLVLEIDADCLISPLRDEPGGAGELFPHLYGPLNRDAVVAVHRLTCGSDGKWVFPTQ